MVHRILLTIAKDSILVDGDIDHTSSQQYVFQRKSRNEHPPSKIFDLEWDLRLPHNVQSPNYSWLPSYLLCFIYQSRHTRNRECSTVLLPPQKSSSTTWSRITKSNISCQSHHCAITYPMIASGTEVRTDPDSREGCHEKTPFSDTTQSTTIKAFWLIDRTNPGVCYEADIL